MSKKNPPKKQFMDDFVQETVNFSIQVLGDQQVPGDLDLGNCNVA